MTFEKLKIENEDGVAIVALHRPVAKNAMSAAMLKELHDAALELRDDLSVRVVVLTGGEEFFTAGVDLKDPELMSVFGKPLGERRRLLEIGPRMCAAWENLPQFTIAAIEGFCVGGGVSLVASCDFRIAAENAFFRIPEIDLGMNYSWNTLPRLVSLVGPAKTKQWVILADKIPAAEALQSGFVQSLTPKGRTLCEALALAERIAAKPHAAVSMTKQAVNACVSDMLKAVNMDADQFALTIASEDFQEGVQAFLEKRKPEFNKT